MMGILFSFLMFVGVFKFSHLPVFFFTVVLNAMFMVLVFLIVMVMVITSIVVAAVGFVAGML